MENMTVLELIGSLTRLVEDDVELLHAPVRCEGGAVGLSEPQVHTTVTGVKWVEV
jgi:hypothetical protein